MKLVLFCHSFVSCWNNGHAHFLRGIAREMIRLDHDVSVFEPESGWSRTNAIRDGGGAPLAEAAALVPGVSIETYREQQLDLDRAVDGADLVIVHEWSAPWLVSAVGRHRIAGARYTLLFHDSHHRSVTAPADLDAFDLEGYDGILAFGEVVREAYLSRGWTRRAFTWHEAADTALFKLAPDQQKNVDLIWIGNWGDEERSRELHSFLIDPAAALGLRTRIHGVRYPQSICTHLAARGVEYAGWLPNHRAPAAYARAQMTVHVPRRPYCEALPGIPTIRVFEALACGVPLVSSPWRDEERLFPDGAYLTAADEADMRDALLMLSCDSERAQEQAAIGLAAILARHTCAHRVQELLAIARTLAARAPTPPCHRTPAQQVSP